MRKMYLIDGVEVTKKVWDCRKMFGEYVGARFEVVIVQSGKNQDLREK